VRTITGILHRELSKAVDGRFFGETMDENGDVIFPLRGSAWYRQDEDLGEDFYTPVYTYEDSYGNSTLEFIYFRDNISKFASSVQPVAVQVRYRVAQNSLLRRERVLSQNERGTWQAPEWGQESTIMSFGDEISNATAGKTTVKFISNTTNYNRKNRESIYIPQWRVVSVTVQVEIYRSMKRNQFEVRSFGPDRQSVRGDPITTKDDIVMAW